MPETLDNIDDLESLLAELSDSDLEETVEAKTQEPAVKPEQVAQAITEIDLDDLDDLTLDDEPVAPKATKPVIEPEVELEIGDEIDLDALELNPVPEAVVEPVEAPKPDPVAKQVDDEVDALLASVEGDTAYRTPVASTTFAAPAKAAEPEDRFVPESDLRTFIDVDRLKDDLSFNETNISLAMTRQAALFAHYSTLAHQAQFQADRADQQVDLVEAQLDQKYRDAFATAGQKITENMIKAAIIKDDKYQKAMLRKHESKAIAEMVKSAADSFRHRRDMLVQVGADLRQQAQGEVRTKEHPGQAAMERLRA